MKTKSKPKQMKQIQMVKHQPGHDKLLQAGGHGPDQKKPKTPP
jgi:hypothetical protein